MTEERFIELLAKKHSGELTLQEQRELSDLTSTQADGAMTSALMEEVFQAQTSFTESITPQLQKESFARISEKINQNLPVSGLGKIRRITVLRYIAAAVLISIIAGSLFWMLKPSSQTNQNSQQIVSTEKGSKTRVVLPDGTKVWLNADTKLRYLSSLGTNTREVTLVGEAYFDVVKDENRPFIVHTATMDVKVLGTAFNVRSYENESTAQTTLIRGKVDVVLKNQDGQTISLKPNEKIIVKNLAKEKTEQPENSEKNVLLPPRVLFEKGDLSTLDSSVYETGWMNNRLVFRQENFEEIVATLERWYNVKITVNRMPESKKFRGTFQNDSLEDVLKAFKASVGINFKIEKDSVTIF